MKRIFRIANTNDLVVEDMSSPDLAFRDFAEQFFLAIVATAQRERGTIREMSPRLLQRYLFCLHQAMTQVDVRAATEAGSQRSSHEDADLWAYCREEFQQQMSFLLTPRHGQNVRVLNGAYAGREGEIVGFPAMLNGFDPRFQLVTVKLANASLIDVTRQDLFPLAF